MLHTQNHAPNTPSATPTANRYRVAAALSLLLLLLQGFHQTLGYQRGLIGAGEVWRLWTGNLVHTNYPHLILNLAGFWLLTVLHPTDGRTLPAQLLWLGSCVGLGLWCFSPQVIWYVGFSGVLYGLFMVCAVQLLRERDWLPGLSILLGMGGKTLWDWWAGGASPTAELIGAPVVYDAHVYGMVGGLWWAWWEN